MSDSLAAGVLRLAIAVILGLAAVILVVPATAQAHTLGRSYAAVAGRLAMNERADDMCAESFDCDLATYPKISARRDCVRFTRHRIVCVGSFELLDFDEGFDEFCTARVSVAYPTHRSIVPRTRVSRVTCF